MNEDITQPPAATGEIGVLSAVRVLRQVYPPEMSQTHILGVTPVVIGRNPGEGGITLPGTDASRRHATISYNRANKTHQVEDLKSRNGTFVDRRQVETSELMNGSVLRIGRSIFVYASCSVPPGGSLPRLDADISLARAMVEGVADRAARSGLPVLIYGPTGAGKERLAERIHQKSGRGGRLVSLNCGALSSDLLGSELFGHVKGSFSGAQSSREGLFATANGGTLFLDEIAELPTDQQPALLRACEQGTVRPVGSDRDLQVDVRLVAATHRNLDEAVIGGQFRADLLARLRGVTLRLPPLCERRDEILALFSRFVGPLSFGRTVAEKLLLHDWPENVRELKNVAEYVLLFAADSGSIHPTHLPEQFAGGPSVTSPPPAGRPSEDALKTLLKEHKGNISKVASALGVHRQQAYRWLARAKLEASEFRD